MLNSAVRYPDVFIDAKSLIEGVVDASPLLSLRTDGVMFANLCDILYLHIEDAEDVEGYSNLTLVVTYKQNVFMETSNFTAVEKTRKLKVLTSIGDTSWTYRMIDKVWEGDYPSTVAVDVTTGEVFFLSIKVNRLELIEFGLLSNLELDTFNLEVHDREPYRITIDSSAMFDYIDGAEGINSLRRNIVVEFNCAVPLRVRSV